MKTVMAKEELIGNLELIKGFIPTDSDWAQKTMNQVIELIRQEAKS